MANLFGEFPVSEEDFGTTTNDGNQKKEKTFLPWHKPRKQWVREKQWWAQIREHIIEPAQEAADTGAIKYLGLPGEDLLDVRFFQKQLNPISKELHFLGFLNSQEAWGRAQDQLSQLLDSQGISKKSKIEMHDFDQMEHDNPLILSKVRKDGPFDIINLDFCDNLISPALQKRRLTALRNMLSYQLQLKPKWLLFVTTRSSKATSCELAFEELLNCVKSNLGNHEFFEKFKAEFSGITLNQGNDSSENPPTLKNEEHILIYVIGLLKWIFSFAVNEKSTAKLTSVVRYSIDGEESDNDMISMCIYFKRELTPPRDKFNLTRPSNGTALPTEPTLAARALEKIAHMKSVDSILEEDQSTYTAMTRSKIGLLKDAGRDVTTYVDEMCSGDLLSMGIDKEIFSATVLPN
ncbi:PP_RS20740 family protein [Chitinimonas naiadis]